MAEQLPRAIEVQEFVNARGPEVETLLELLRCSKGDSFGAPALLRHLRRRATSHNRYITRRRPNLKVAERFAESVVEGGSMEAAQNYMQRPTNRAMRRRPDRLLKVFSSPPPITKWPPHQDGIESVEQNGKSFRSTGNRSYPMEQKDSIRGLKKDTLPSKNSVFFPWDLESRSWHSRRMKMEHRWGVLLPSHTVGRGRGSRSFMHHAQHGLVMHDAGYCACLQIQGHQRELVQILSKVSDPVILNEEISRPEIICGASEWSVVLHHPGQFPQRAICPVRAMFVTCTKETSNISSSPEFQNIMSMDVDVDRGSDRQGKEGTMAHGGSDDEGLWYSDCALWLWVHCAAVHEVGQALNSLLISSGSSSYASLQLLSHRRLELIGPRAEVALLSVLSPVSGSQEGNISQGQDLGSDILSGIWAALRLNRAGPGTSLRKQWVWPSDCVLGLRAKDPRLARPIRAGGLMIDQLELGQHQREGTALDPKEMERQLKGWPEKGDWSTGAKELLMQGRIRKEAGADSLAPHKIVPRPWSEAQVSEARSAARSVALVGAASSGGKADKGPRSTYSPTFPLLLIKRSYSTKGNGSPCGWSVIIPSGWVMPLWSALTFQGARPAGQLEWRWLASLAQAPCFPYDFPHTTSGEAWLDTQRHRDMAAAAKRPSGRMRKLPAAPYIPWGGSCFGASLEQGRDPLLPQPIGGYLPISYLSPEYFNNEVPQDLGQQPRSDNVDSETCRHSQSGLGHIVLMSPRAENSLAPRSQSAKIPRVEQKCRRFLKRALLKLEQQSGHQKGSPLPSVGPLSHPQSHVCNPEVPHSNTPKQHSTVLVGETSRILVYVRVQVIGRGRCQEGATVCIFAGSDDLELSAGFSSESVKPPVVIGFVTSGTPRGLPAGSYPGGLALCDLKLLKQQGTDLRVCLINARSQTLRRVVLHPITSYKSMVEPLLMDISCAKWLGFRKQLFINERPS